MTTYTQSAVLDHTSLAGFQAWAADFFNAWTNGAFSAAGTMYPTMQQTSDTGQMTSTSLAALGSKPGTNTAAGYIVMAFNDTNHTTTPIFVKLEVGTGASTNNPSFWITVGASSNGSGTIGNVILARTQYTSAPVSTTTSYTTSACAVDGMFALVFKQTGFTSGVSFVMLFGRSFDPSTGSATADGWFICFSIANSQANAISIEGVGPVGYSVSAAYCMIPHGITASLSGGVAQPFKWYCATPKIMPLPFLCVLNAEIPDATEFDATPFGSTSRHFKTFNQGGSQNFNLNNMSSTNLSFIWE